MRYLLVAEKPSLMKEIKACYERHRGEVVEKVGEIEFIALSGHVCRFVAPDEYPQWEGAKWQDISYPMIPTEWKIAPIDDAGKKKTLKEIKARAAKCDGIIVGTDSDVEGYGIYWLAEHLLGLTDKPTLRFIEHSLTDGEILSSLLSMTDYHARKAHRDFTDSYLIRARADWLFGMNATRMMSVRTGETMRVGRVKAPTVKLIYDNSMAIEKFVPQDYYVVAADYVDFKGTLLGSDGKEARFAKEEDAGTYPLKGKVESVAKKRVTTRAPKLFDLASAQAEAGRQFGFSPSHTLDVIQSLYEKHKAISYPRTQCKFVSSEKAKEFKLLLSNMDAFGDLAAPMRSVTDRDIMRASKDKNVVNDKEVQKESHDALLPTSVKARPETMTEDERKICRMIYARFLAQFLPAAEDDKTSVKIKHGSGVFLAEGKTVAEPGWRDVLSVTSKETYLPELTEGQDVDALSIAPSKRTTKAPKRLTQYSLVHAMENIAELITDKELKKSLADSKGIGTSATRASIISEIIKSGYATDSKAGLAITDLGKRYVELLSGTGISSPEFAAVMDTEIKRVQRGEAEYGTVYGNVLKELDAVCGKIAEIPRTFKEAARGDGKVPESVCGHKLTAKEKTALSSGGKTEPMKLTGKSGKKFAARLYMEDGKIQFDFSSGITCPCCGENDVRLNSKGAFCDCGFKAFRECYGTKLSDAQLKKLLTEGRTDEINTFVSKKTGKQYSGFLKVEGNGVTIEFPEKAESPDTQRHPEGILCPSCRDMDVRINRGGAFCDCGFKAFRKEFGAELSDEELAALLTERKTGTIDRFISKKTGKGYSGSLYLDKDNSIKLSFR